MEDKLKEVSQMLGKCLEKLQEIVNYRKEDEAIYYMGDCFLICDDRYILARLSDYKFGFINLVDGNRFSDDCISGGFDYVSEIEIKKHLENSFDNLKKIPNPYK